MFQRFNSLQKFSQRSALPAAVLSVCLVGGGLAVAQTKQLKEPTPPSAADQTGTAPQNFSRSYSVVVEERTDKDGKTVQTKKVWQDGKLVESEEKTLDGSEATDATIDLPNGRVLQGRIAPGRPNAVDPSSIFGDPNASPFEAIRQMESEWRERQAQIEAQMQEQFEMFRQRFGSENDFPNAFQNNAALSKYWIGANVESTPEIVAAQLPIEPNEGVLIQAVVPESPCAQAGLQRFDVVVKIDGQKIDDATAIGKLVDEIGAKTVKIEYFRKGQLVETDLTIAKRPQIDAAALNGSAFGANGPASKQFRIVRPGLIVPAPEAEEAAKSTTSADAEKTLADKTAEAAAYLKTEAEKAAQKASDKAAELGEKIGATASAAAEKAGEAASNLKEKASETAADLKAKASAAVEKAAETAADLTSKAENAVKEANAEAEKTRELPPLETTEKPSENSAPTQNR